MHSLLVVLGITSFWMFSPEALVLTGNGGGVGAGLGLLAFLCLSAVICLGTSLVGGDQIVKIEKSLQVQRSRAGLVGIIGVAGMVGTMLFGSTGILVTAGFTFNEVIYYRFPNFAFAFILLAAALAVPFLSTLIREMIIVITVAICFIGITALVVYGLVSEPIVPFSFVDETSSVMRLLPLLLVFVGIDRASVFIRVEPLRFWIGFGLCILLLSGWMYVSARFVEPHRLMDSTIPYMVAAGKIGGEFGRVTMGIVIISGSFGAVQWLMRIVSSAVSHMFIQKGGETIEKGLTVLLAIGVGGMMAFGVAGTDLLEVYIRSSLILWMVHTGLMIFFGSLEAGKNKPLKATLGMITSTTILLGSLALFLNQEKVIVAACFAVSMIIGAVLLVSILTVLNSYRGPEDIQINNNTEV